MVQRKLKTELQHIVDAESHKTNFTVTVHMGPKNLKDKKAAIKRLFSVVSLMLVFANRNIAKT